MEPFRSCRTELRWWAQKNTLPIKCRGIALFIHTLFCYQRLQPSPTNSCRGTLRIPVLTCSVSPSFLFFSVVPSFLGGFLCQHLCSIPHFFSWAGLFPQISDIHQSVIKQTFIRRPPRARHLHAVLQRHRDGRVLYQLSGDSCWMDWGRFINKPS